MHKYQYPKQFSILNWRYKYVTTEYVQQKDRLSCAQCKDILIEPYQTDCGCRFCSSCLDKCTNVCPGCRDNIKSMDIRNLTYDKAVEKEILQLQIKCINDPCTHECKLRDLIGHLETCEFKENQSMKCNDCSMVLLKKEFSEIHRNIHGNIDSLCDKWSGVCPYNCCDAMQDNIKVHFGICPNISVDCPMKNVGCTKVLRRSSMDDHIRKEVQGHMMLMMKELVRVKEDKQRIKLEHMECNHVLSIEIEELKSTVAIQYLEIHRLKEKILKMESNYSSMSSEVNSYKESMKWDGVPRSCPLKAPSSVSSITSDGYYMWKVDNIVSKIKDAMRGINTLIFSDPFYTHTPGYKMCLKMYPDGDGKRAENHISLYFVIMQGDYDEEVAWPFRKKISLSLQSNEASIKNKTINMKADNNNSCYGKPTSAYNLAAGQPKFLSHFELISTDEFIENDAITIHAKVF